MPTNKTHKLKTIEDLFRVATIENVEALLRDLRGVLLNALLTKALIDAENPGADFDMFAGAVIDWTDDNVNRQSITAQGSDNKIIEFRMTGPNDESSTQ